MPRRQIVRSHPDAECHHRRPHEHGRNDCSDLKRREPQKLQVGRQVNADETVAESAQRAGQNQAGSIGGCAGRKNQRRASRKFRASSTVSKMSKIFVTLMRSHRRRTFGVRLTKAIAASALRIVV